MLPSFHFSCSSFCLVVFLLYGRLVPHRLFLRIILFVKPINRPQYFYLVDNDELKNFLVKFSELGCEPVA